MIILLVKLFNNFFFQELSSSVELKNCASPNYENEKKLFLEPSGMILSYYMNPSVASMN